MNNNPFIGSAPALRAVIDAAAQVAATDVNVLLQGESGTGKELLARHIHDTGRRAGRAFVAVNCAALPEALAESLLFGHRKGAFTGAASAHDGHVRSAAGGTLFLDEVAELSGAAQAKLLRFLESGEVLPVGASRPLRADVRILAATHRDLRGAVAAGHFRADLYHRLNVVPLALPPLRECAEDVPLLLAHFLERMAVRHGLQPPRPDSASLALLQAYRWPGNVRELRNLCERLVVLHPGMELTPDQLPAELRRALPSRPANDAVFEFGLPEEGLSLEAVEVSLIRQALQRADGNRSGAARLLGISRDTLLYRLKKFAIA
jgi:DNA-binding NtrC family response regulator